MRHLKPRCTVRTVILRNVNRPLSQVASWTTDLRYTTGTLKRHDADTFMKSVIAIIAWDEGRM